MNLKRFAYTIAAALPLLSPSAFAQQPQLPATATDLVQRALERNRDFLAAKARVTEAQALLRQAGLRPYPTIEVEGATGKLLGSSGEREYSAAYFHPIERGGKRTKRAEVAEKGVALAEAEVEERKRQLTFDIKSRFIQAVAEDLKLATINRLLPINRENYQLTVKRVDLGDAAPLEQQLLLTDVNRAEAQQMILSSRAEGAVLDLKAVVGLGRGDSLTIVPDFGFDNRERTLDQLQQLALENRPDLRILTILEEQALAEAELAKAEGQPDLTASARYTRSVSRFDQLGLSEGGAVVPLRDADNVVTFGLSIPLFTRQRAQGAVDAALSRANQARLQREHLQQAITQEVEAAYRRWSGTRRALGILQSGVVQQSEKNLIVIREAYSLGQLRVMDVLNEQRRLVETELAYVDAQGEAALAFAELERALGGDLP